MFSPMWLMRTMRCDTSVLCTLSHAARLHALPLCASDTLPAAAATAPVLVPCACGWLGGDLWRAHRRRKRGPHARRLSGSHVGTPPAGMTVGACVHGMRRAACGWLRPTVTGLLPQPWFSPDAAAESTMLHSPTRPCHPDASHARSKVKCMQLTGYRCSFGALGYWSTQGMVGHLAVRHVCCCVNCTHGCQAVLCVRVVASCAGGGRGLAHPLATGATAAVAAGDTATSCVPCSACMCCGLHCSTCLLWRSSASPVWMALNGAACCYMELGL